MLIGRMRLMSQRLSMLQVCLVPVRMAVCRPLLALSGSTAAAGTLWLDCCCCCSQAAHQPHSPACLLQHR